MVRAAKPLDKNLDAVPKEEKENGFCESAGFLPPYNFPTEKYNRILKYTWDFLNEMLSGWVVVSAPNSNLYNGKAMGNFTWLFVRVSFNKDHRKLICFLTKSSICPLWRKKCEKVVILLMCRKMSTECCFLGEAVLFGARD